MKKTSKTVSHTTKGNIKMVFYEGGVPDNIKKCSNCSGEFVKSPKSMYGYNLCDKCIEIMETKDGFMSINYPKKEGNETQQKEE